MKRQRMDLWLERRDVQRAAVRAFDAWLADAGIEVVGDIDWNFVGTNFDDIEVDKTEAIGLLTWCMISAFERSTKPQGSA
jgi:hypothetical protein